MYFIFSRSNKWRFLETIPSILVNFLLLKNNLCKKILITIFNCVAVVSGVARLTHSIVELFNQMSYSNWISLIDVIVIFGFMS